MIFCALCARGRGDKKIISVLWRCIIMGVAWFVRLERNGKTPVRNSCWRSICGKNKNSWQLYGSFWRLNLKTLSCLGLCRTGGIFWNQKLLRVWCVHVEKVAVISQVRSVSGCLENRVGWRRLIFVFQHYVSFYHPLWCSNALDRRRHLVLLLSLIFYI